jgi:hypothetical protein
VVLVALESFHERNRSFISVQEHTFSYAIIDVTFAVGAGTPAHISAALYRPLPIRLYWLTRNWLPMPVNGQTAGVAELFNTPSPFTS